MQKPVHETESVKFVNLPTPSKKLQSLCEVGIAIGIGDQRQKIMIDSQHSLVSIHKYIPHLQCVNLFVPPREYCLRFASVVINPISFCALSKSGGNDTCQVKEDSCIHYLMYGFM